MYAPKWATITPQLPGWCDVEFDFDPLTLTIAPGQQLLKNELLVDGDADYLDREIVALPIAGTTGTLNPQDLKIRLTDGDAQFITSDWVTLNDINGPVGPAVLAFRKGSKPYFDIWNQSETSTAVVVVGFKGWKRVKCDAKQADLPKFVPQSQRFCKPWAPGIRFEEYEYFFEFVNGTLATAPPWCVNLEPQTPNQQFNQFALRTDDDASFLWRGTSGMIMSLGGGVAIPGNWFLRFYDNALVPLARQDSAAEPNAIAHWAGGRAGAFKRRRSDESAFPGGLYPTRGSRFRRYRAAGCDHPKRSVFVARGEGIRGGHVRDLKAFFVGLIGHRFSPAPESVRPGEGISRPGVFTGRLFNWNRKSLGSVQC